MYVFSNKYGIHSNMLLCTCIIFSRGPLYSGHAPTSRRQRKFTEPSANHGFVIKIVSGFGNENTGTSIPDQVKIIRNLK